MGDGFNMVKECFICDRISKIKEGTNPYFVRELNTGYIVLGDYQFYRGHTIFLCKEHVVELHELSDDFKQEFLKEMSLVAEAVWQAFKPAKLNYEMLGNFVKHAHWHIIPRYADDPDPLNPVWVIDKKIREADSAKPGPKLLGELKKELKAKVEELLHGESIS